MVHVVDVAARAAPICQRFRSPGESVGYRSRSAISRPRRARRRNVSRSQRAANLSIAAVRSSTRCSHRTGRVPDGTIVTEPVSGGWFPARSDRKVDFPAPFAPTRPVQPRPRSKEASSMTETADDYEYEACETWMADLATPLVGGSMTRRWCDPQLVSFMGSPSKTFHVYLLTVSPSSRVAEGHARGAAPEDRPTRQNERRPTRRGTSPDHRRGRPRP
jgi:hypothetical protein